MKMTTEVTAIKKASPETGLFELPAGYQEAPMFSPTGASTSGNKGGQPKAGTADDNPFMKIMQQMNKK
jgi:hypothetical protein